MSEVVWSINIMIAILLVAVGIVIYYIFKYDEFWPNGSDDTTKQEELLQFPSDKD
jgi:ABC-type cobalt transport system substrate-binding protein